MATVEEAKKALLKLFIAFPTFGTEEERRLRFETYWEVLSIYSPDHVIFACQYAARGKVEGDANFIPSAGQLARLARDEDDRKARLAPKGYDPVLGIENRPDAATKARVLAGLKQLANDLRTNPIGSLACTPMECPKKYGMAVCPRRGTGICRQTSEIGFGSALDAQRGLGKQASRGLGEDLDAYTWEAENLEFSQ